MCDDGTRSSVRFACCSFGSQQQQQQQQLQEFFGALKQEVTLCHVLNKLDLQREGDVDRSVPHCLQSARCIGARNSALQRLKSELSESNISSGRRTRTRRSLETHSSGGGSSLTGNRQKAFWGLKMDVTLDFTEEW